MPLKYAPLRTAASIGAALLALSLIHDHLTAERRFLENLDAELWKLAQPGVDRAELSTEARAHLRAVLCSRDPMSRWQAALVLAHWKDRDSVPDLVAAMQDDRGTRRTCVMAQCLGAVADSNAVNQLRT